LADLVTAIRDRPGPVRLVGIDGCAGAGKTTLATRLSAAASSAPVVHTDDFASYEDPFGGWPRLLDQVLEPLLCGTTATFRAYDWDARRLADDSITIPPASIVVIEGVGATRGAWRDRLALRVWVDCPRELRLRRGIERDGEALREFWLSWMQGEDGYVAAESPRDHADLVVDGAPSVPHDPAMEFVQILSGRRATPAGDPTT
jgi:uridine kinase